MSAKVCAGHQVRVVVMADSGTTALFTVRRGSVEKVIFPTEKD